MFLIQNILCMTLLIFIWGGIIQLNDSWKKRSKSYENLLPIITKWIHHPKSSSLISPPLHLMTEKMAEDLYQIKIKSTDETTYEEINLAPYN